MNSRSFRLLPSAEHEVNEAFDWYQSERYGLGDEFRNELKLALNRVMSTPLQFPVVYGRDVRRAGIDRFPYSIIFEVDVGSILVLAVFHEKRNPVIWRRRVG